MKKKKLKKEIKRLKAEIIHLKMISLIKSNVLSLMHFENNFSGDLEINDNSDCPKN